MLSLIAFGWLTVPVHSDDDHSSSTTEKIIYKAVTLPSPEQIEAEKKKYEPIVPDKYGVCHGDIDIRNQPMEMNRLRDCAIVAGSISIALFDFPDRIDDSYPKLR